MPYAPAHDCRALDELTIRFYAMAPRLLDRETGGMPERKRKRSDDDLPVQRGRKKRVTANEPGSSRRWTDTDDAFILSHCAAMTDSEMAQALDRSRVGVLIRRLKVLGIRKAAPLNVWSDDDDAMLKTLYGEVDTTFLAAILSRPSEALRARAFYLRLRKRHEWTPGEEEILRKHYPCVPVPEFANLLPGRTDRNIYHRADVLGLERDGTYVLGCRRQRFHAYPSELQSLIRLHNQVKRKLEDVKTQYRELERPSVQGA